MTQFSLSKVFWSGLVARWRAWRKARAQQQLMADLLHASASWDCDCLAHHAERVLRHHDVPRGRAVRHETFFGIPVITAKKDEHDGPPH